MQPRLVFLGTGGDAITVGKGTRLSGGIIFMVEDNQFHIDPGIGAVAKARDYGVNLRSTIAVLISHAHQNHCNDANAVINTMTAGGLDKKGVLVTNKTVWNGSADYDPAVNRYFKTHVERNIILEPGQRVGINEIEIKATHTLHSEPDAIGFRITCPQFTLGYTGDTGYTTQLLEDFKGTDILIMNVVHPKEKKDQYLLNVDDAIKLLSEIKPKLGIITHFGIKFDDISEVRNMQRLSGVETLAAKDGMVLNPMTHTIYGKNF
jgi:ribonuclease BN (tRNA processing enzyme)